MIIKVREAKTNKDNDVCLEGLLSYLSQVLLSKKDETIKKLHEEVESGKGKISGLRKEFLSTKDRVKVLELEYAKQKIMNRVLYTISVLKSEGVLIGKNRVKISSILNQIDSYSFNQLTNLEIKLASYLPEKYSK